MLVLSCRCVGFAEATFILHTGMRMKGGGGLRIWMDRFAVRAPIRVIRTESDESGPIYLSLSFSCKFHSNPSEQSGIHSSELDTGSTAGPWVPMGI